jgi:hypothetical protein
MARCATQRLLSYHRSNSHVQVQAFQLGSVLRKEYFDPSSANYIHNIRNDLVDLDQVHARIKVGCEGRVAFDSTIALLQGLFPPTEKNTIELANEVKVTAPLGGYQYIPGEPYMIFVDVIRLIPLRQLKQWSPSTTVPLKAGQAAR